MDTKTIILLSVGILTIATMIYCIMRSAEPKPKSSDMVITDDQSESNYETIEEQMDDGDESVYEST